MAFLDDLAKSVGLFNQGMQNLATANAFKRANEQVRQAENQILSEQERRQAAEQVSTQLGQELLQAGAPVSRIQAASALFGPAPAPTGEQLIREGQTQAGQELQRQQAAVGEELFETREQRKFRRQQLLQEARASAQQTKLRPIPVGELKTLGDRDDEIATGERLLNQVLESPELTAPVLGRIPGGAEARALVNPEFARFKADLGRWFDLYRKRITGAQATEREINFLRQNIPNVEDPPEVLKAKLEGFLEIGRDQRRRQLQKLKKARFDTGFLEEVEETAPAAQQPTAPAPPAAPQGIPGLEF